MVNSQMLKEKMKEQGVSVKELALSLDIAAPTMSQKINNVRPMYLDEVWDIAQKLQIDVSDYGAYFFNHEIA